MKRGNCCSVKQNQEQTKDLRRNHKSTQVKLIYLFIYLFIARDTGLPRTLGLIEGGADRIMFVFFFVVFFFFLFFFFLIAAPALARH